MHDRHTANLDWYFSAGGTRFFSSPFGRILDIQQARYLDPKKGEEKGGTARRSSGRSKKTGKFSVSKETDDPTHFVTDWQFMHIRQEDHGQPAEPELRDLHRYGHVSSALYKLEKVNPLYVSALMALHGDNGARWSQERGEGRMLAVYPLTETGSKWVAFMEKNSELKVRPDERLATECFQQEKNPEDVRRARLKKVEAEARELYKSALAKYVELAT